MAALTIYHCFILGGLILILANVLANLLTLDELEPAEPPAEPPLVSILVPARNEERNIEMCVGSLLGQDYPNIEVLVLDDHSDDGTGPIVERLMADARAKNPRLHAVLLQSEALPAGWIGKTWACHQLAQAARGQFLFFTDADTRHAPSTVTAAATYALRQRAGLLSVWPMLITVTLGEKLVVPMIHFACFALCPLWLQRWMQQRPERARRRLLRRIGLANGQFMFFARETYARVGGHAAVKMHFVEDVALGRKVAARIHEGERLFNCQAPQFSQVRMYQSFREAWNGFTRNMLAVSEGRHLAFGIFELVVSVCFLGPFVALWWTPPPLRWLVVAQIGLIFTICLLLAMRCRTSWIGLLLHPVGILLLVLIGFNSWWRSTGFGVVWKGRTYKPKI